MPEQLKKSEVDMDPTVAKQYDDETPTQQKFDDFAAMADGLKIGLMGTLRDGIGPVARSMAVAKRTGPDFLFLANANSQKFNDLEKSSVANVYFQNSSNQDWISVTGEAVTASNDDPRIKEVHSKSVKAWFGDLGDGVHNAEPEDPRMKLIEVKAKYINYWKHEVGAAGFMKEVGGAVMTGGVANTGTLRKLDGKELEEMRSKHGAMSS
ncbi:hypothetical protein LTR37_019804 [Vermiconidia calcicola]|uniref:Uncharacterized protein n=1 Tax=Vermiconidia calcicola TaxID=1690605 RepID=A0ACC3MD73_9PEZI|nr:hypothetical protein LTR37_019804 [Vermiconidia calcicola]